jgi:hypothetical protein
VILTDYFSKVRISSQNLPQKIRECIDSIREEFGEKFTEGGEPEILFNKKNREVWVSTGDWHDTEIVQALFDKLENIPGITQVDGESESYPEGYDYGQGPSDWEKIES